MIATGGARSLDAAACDALLRARGGTVVGIVAGPEVGKTTMIATMYELVHRGRMKSFKFAGSETLRGYEERCHLARMSSNGAKADTTRTRTADQLSFTHLRLATSSGIKDIIFSDRSGEHFDNVLDRPSEIFKFSELQRADAILLLVDLEQLYKSPHQPKSQVRRLFLAMEQTGLLVGKSVTFVGTKADLLESPNAAEDARLALTELAAELGRRSSGGLHVASCCIASRAKAGSVRIGEGLEDLLNEILVDDEVSGFMLGTAWPSRVSELDGLMYSFRSVR